MLQALRQKTSGLIAKIVLGALIFVFSFFGIESYFIARNDTWVAKVDGREITPEQYRQRFDEYRQQMTRMMGGNLDGAMFERIETKRQVLDGLIDEQLLLAANEKLGVVVPDDVVRDEIRDIPAFQSSGKFDANIYRATLSAQRMTPAMFEERVRQDLSVRQIPNQIIATGVATSADIDTFVKLRDQTRDLHYAMLDKPATTESKVDDSDIEKYYKEHTAEFTAPEQVALEFLELDGSKLKVEASADEAALHERYDKEKARYVSPEQRQASHVLIKVAKNADPEAQKAALAKAQDVAKQAKAGKDFAALAKQYSDDLGSKAQGGDLGWLEKGVTDPAFDTALFALKKGEISEPVLSDEGYHVIQLRELREEHARSFDEVKPELVKEVLDGERDRAFNAQASKLTDAVYADPSSLEPAAKELGLAIQKTGLFSRQGGSEGIAANPAVVKSAFSDAVLVEGNSSDPIDIGPNHKIVVRVAEHKPATPKPLDAVREEIRARLIANATSEQAKRHAEEVFQRLQSGENFDKLAGELKLKIEEQKSIGRNAANLDGKLVAEVFKLPRPAAGKPQFALVPLANDTYALARLDAVNDGDPSKLDAAARDQVRSQLERGTANQAARAFIDTLRKTTKIEIAEDRLP